jgi:hypothetical protein
MAVYSRNMSPCILLYNFLSYLLTNIVVSLDANKLPILLHHNVTAPIKYIAFGFIVTSIGKVARSKFGFWVCHCCEWRTCFLECDPPPPWRSVVFPNVSDTTWRLRKQQIPPKFWQCVTSHKTISSGRRQHSVALQSQIAQCLMLRHCAIWTEQVGRIEYLMQFPTFF